LVYGTISNYINCIILTVSSIEILENLLGEIEQAPMLIEIAVVALYSLPCEH